MGPSAAPPAASRAAGQKRRQSTWPMKRVALGTALLAQEHWALPACVKVRRLPHPVHLQLGHAGMLAPSAH